MFAVEHQALDFRIAGCEDALMQRPQQPKHRPARQSAAERRVTLAALAAPGGRHGRRSIPRATPKRRAIIESKES